jgi:hypothetical protein
MVTSKLQLPKIMENKPSPCPATLTVNNPTLGWVQLLKIKEQVCEENVVDPYQRNLEIDHNH